MPRHAETRFVPFSPMQMYALVADIEHYPDFLPLCQGARLLSRHDTFIEAELSIGYKRFQESFLSRVDLTSLQKIVTTHTQGPLKHLTSEWRFTDAKGAETKGKSLCKIDFFVDFSFRSPLLNAMMDALFDQAFRQMVDAFERRAAKLYADESD